MKKTKLLIFLTAALIVVCSFAACGEDVNTPKTSALTTESSIQTKAETTPAGTSTLDETSAPETTPAPAWMAKIEENFFEKAVKEDGKYYIYLTYKFQSSSYAVNDNQTFVEAYVANEKDIVFADLESGMISQGIYLRASAEEIEAYAKNSYVTGIYSYAQDKVVEGCKASFVRMDGCFDPYAMHELAGGKGPLPLIKIDSKDELSLFVDTYIYRKADGFEEMISLYDDAYFAEKTLFLMTSVNSTGSERYSLIHVLSDQGIQIVLDLSCDIRITTDVAFWLIFVEVENGAVENQTSFEVVVK